MSSSRHGKRREPQEFSGSRGDSEVHPDHQRDITTKCSIQETVDSEKPKREQEVWEAFREEHFEGMAVSDYDNSWI